METEINMRAFKNIPFLQKFSQNFLFSLSQKVIERDYGPDEKIMEN